MSSSVLTPGEAQIETGGDPTTIPSEPPSGAASAAKSRATRSPWWVEVGVIVWLCWVYDAITNLAPLRLELALSHARGILDLERSLHLDPELSLDRWLAGHHTLGLFLSDYYDNAHFVVTLGLLGYLWWRRADIYRPLRNVLVLTNVLAFVVFWRFPVAPPRMLHGFTDVVASSGAFGSWHTGALASQADQLAAVPSLHMAWAGWCTLAVWRMTSRRWPRVVAILYPCVTGLAVLATGNHFLLDVLAGLFTLAVSVLIVRIATTRRQGLRGRGGVGRPSTS
ncbi:MAG: phosphatase PAP2 family protein [Solirubrobacteraceae bacterium]